MTTLTLSFTPQLRPLGAATTVLRKVLQGMRAGTADVPCQGCTACCRAGYAVHLTAAEAARLPAVPDTDGTPLLPRNADGSCAMLVDNRCSIYTHRPQACRDYDCRTFALVGLFPSRLLDRTDFTPFAITLSHLADREVTTAMRLAALAPVQQGKPPEEAARLAVLTYGRYLPLARRLCDAADIDPAFTTQIQAALQSLVTTVPAHGDGVEVPRARRAPHATAPPKRMTRRRLLTAGRGFRYPQRPGRKTWVPLDHP